MKLKGKRDAPAASMWKRKTNSYSYAKKQIQWHKQQKCYKYHTIMHLILPGGLEKNIDSIYKNMKNKNLSLLTYK